ncbi:unnamed protein product [Laminaria digitata]
MTGALLYCLPSRGRSFSFPYLDGREGYINSSCGWTTLVHLPVNCPTGREYVGPASFQTPPRCALSGNDHTPTVESNQNDECVISRQFVSRRETREKARREWHAQPNRV